MNACALQRMKHLVGINERALPEDTEPEREFRYADITSVGRGVLVSEPERVRFRDAPSRARRLVAAGDTIVSTVRTYLRAVWPVAGATDDLVVSTGFAVLTPGPRLDSRYLGWWAQSDPFVEEIVARSVGVSYPAINASEIGDLYMPVPPLPVQRAIADYLDAETARIDALIARKRRMIELLEEREQAAVLELAGDHRSTPTVTLRQLGTSVLTGPFGTQLAATEYVDGGVPVINPTHILRGRIVPDESVSVSDETAARLSRHKLAEGDIVLGRKGDVGRSAVVGVQNSGWICGSDSIAVRTDPRRLSPAFLALVLHVDLYRQQLAAFSTGAMVTGINEGILLGMQVPCLSLDEQARVTQAARATVEWNERFTSTLGCQIELLTEHRQALITAAVTGALVVPGVSA